jgi:uncharacterized protein YjbI with pentapeptide repeats
MRPDPPDLPPEPEEPDLSAARIAEAELVGVSLAGERRPNLSLVDCAMRECDLANLDARGAMLRRVAISTGRMTGCNLTESKLHDVSISDCRADLVALTASVLERVAFVSCNLAQSDFQEARMDAVVFEQCDLREADLSGARFKSVEMRGCRLERVRGADRLRGVRMPWVDVVANAGLFAGACGVEVLEEGLGEE